MSGSSNASVTSPPVSLSPAAPSSETSLSPHPPSVSPAFVSLPSVSRRNVLAAGAAGAGAVAASALVPATAWANAPVAGRKIHDPFALGVASGEPLPDGVVLWTRLAPDPLATDGRGGMPAANVRVQWQVASDERFRHVVDHGVEFARSSDAHSVHVEVNGLRPGTEYFYRFRVGSEVSPVGRTRTAPADGARLDRFRFATTSCQNYPDGFFNAHAHLAQEDLDLVIFLGDYIYEGPAQGSIGRGHVPTAETFNLAEYRVRHAQYRSDTDLQAAHAAHPWVVIFDDHEVDNNWADDDSDPDTDPEDFRRRRTAAFQAYYEHMPLRRAQRPRGPDVQMYRRVTFGDLIDFHVLDTRQYRSDQTTDEERDDPSRTLLGAEQKEWLFDALAGPTARWNVLGNQVFFSQRDFAAGATFTDFSNDAWDNYMVERNALRDHMTAAGTSNPVVITGDVHANYVCDVKADFDDPDSATVATELVGTSITSGGDGGPRPNDPVQLQENPHIKFLNRKRGYLRNTVTRDEWTADMRIVDYVSSRGAPVTDLASFVIENGRPGARRVS